MHRSSFNKRNFDKNKNIFVFNMKDRYILKYYDIFNAHMEDEVVSLGLMDHANIAFVDRMCLHCVFTIGVIHPFPKQLRHRSGSSKYNNIIAMDDLSKINCFALCHSCVKGHEYDFSLEWFNTMYEPSEMHNILHLFQPSSCSKVNQPPNPILKLKNYVVVCPRMRYKLDGHKNIKLNCFVTLIQLMEEIGPFKMFKDENHPNSIIGSCINPRSN